MASKYIVDIVGDLPTILLEMDPDNSMSIEKAYIYGNSQRLSFPTSMSLHALSRERRIQIV